MSKVAIVTGGTSGIGLAAVNALRAKGCTVYALSRRGEIPCDVSEVNSVRAAVQTVLDKEGRIDILVNCAGFGISGAAESTASKDSHAQLELNLFGMDNVTRSVLPHMREQRSGRIVCMSSIAGILPIPFQLWYSVSKSAILAYVLALQNEIRPYGISVCAIMPGDIASGFTDARVKSEALDGEYAGRIARSVAVMEHDERTGMKPEDAGRFVAKVALRKRSRPMIAMGFAYKAAAMAAKLLPRRFSNWLVGLIYAK